MHNEKMENPLKTKSYAFALRVVASRIVAVGLLRDSKDAYGVHQNSEKSNAQCIMHSAQCEM